MLLEHKLDLNAVAEPDFFLRGGQTGTTTQTGVAMKITSLFT